MKVCSKCGQQKELREYFVRDKRTGRLHAQCKAYYKVMRAAMYLKHYQKHQTRYQMNARKRREALRLEFQQNMLNYLQGRACTDCGETDIVVFELDHIDPATKLFNISQAVRLGYNWDQVLQEIKKCQIVCANCHKRRTAKQFGWYKSSGGTYRI